MVRRTLRLRRTISVFVCVALLIPTALFLTTIITHAAPVAPCATDARGCGATTKFVPLEKFEGSDKLSNVYESGELSVFLNRLFLAAMSLGAVLAVLRLAWAGFQYMASDLWSSKEHAKEIIRETLLGLFILLSVFLILKQINPNILSLNVGFPSIEPNAPAYNTDDSQQTSFNAGADITPDTP